EPVELAPLSLARTTLLSADVPAPSSPRRTSSRPFDRRVDRALPLLDAIGMVAGAVVPALGLLGPSAEVARLPLVVGAFVALATRLALVRRDPADPHTLVVAGPTFGAVAATCWAWAAHDSHAPAIAVMAGLA